MQTVAVGWDLYERTGSALALGGVGLVQVLPVVALTLPAGHIVDRWSRKGVLIGALLLMVISSLGMAAVSYTRAHFALMYVCLLLQGTGRAFFSPAKESLGPQLLPNELFPEGATWRSTAFELAAVLGPALGGTVIGITHSATPAYLIAACTAATFAILVSSVKPRPFIPPEQTGMRDALLGGVRFMRKQPILLAIITLDMFAVFLGGATALLPIFAKDILHVGPSGLGFMLAAPSVGALLTAAALTQRPPMQRAGRALLLSVVGFGLATIGLGLSRSFNLSMVMLVLIGGFDCVSVVIRMTLLQLLTPDALRGRVNAINSLFVGMSNELGEFESGTLAAITGPVAAVVIGGVGTIVSVLAVARVWPNVRHLGSLRHVHESGSGQLPNPENSSGIT